MEFEEHEPGEEDSGDDIVEIAIGRFEFLDENHPDVKKVAFGAFGVAYHAKEGKICMTRRMSMLGMILSSPGVVDVGFDPLKCNEFIADIDRGIKELAMETENTVFQQIFLQNVANYALIPSGKKYHLISFPSHWKSLFRLYIQGSPNFGDMLYFSALNHLYNLPIADVPIQEGEEETQKGHRQRLDRMFEFIRRQHPKPCDVYTLMPSRAIWKKQVKRFQNADLLCRKYGLPREITRRICYQSIL